MWIFIWRRKKMGRKLVKNLAKVIGVGGGLCLSTSLLFALPTSVGGGDVKNPSALVIPKKLAGESLAFIRKPVPLTRVSRESLAFVYRRPGAESLT
jgi:hypothetical protein